MNKWKLTINKIFYEYYLSIIKYLGHIFWIAKNHLKDGLITKILVKSYVLYSHDYSKNGRNPNLQGCCNSCTLYNYYLPSSIVLIIHMLECFFNSFRNPNFYGSNERPIYVQDVLKLDVNHYLLHLLVLFLFVSYFFCFTLL